MTDMFGLLFGNEFEIFLFYLNIHKDFLPLDFGINNLYTYLVRAGLAEPV